RDQPALEDLDETRLGGHGNLANPPAAGRTEKGPSGPGPDAGSTSPSLELPTIHPKYKRRGPARVGEEGSGTFVVGAVAAKLSPILGYNHNVRYRGVIFHVQTEDSGLTNPHVFTHLFHGGVILSTRKLVYDPDASEEAVKSLMQSQ